MQRVWQIAVAFIVLVGFAEVLHILSPPHRPGITGITGYTTFTGPHGYPLQIGQPWGHTCQPIVFQVEPHISDSDYAVIANTVSLAHTDGLDVGIETRDFHWFPAQLWPPGQTNMTIEVVPIYASWAKSPILPDGHLGRINFSWNAALSPDGHHEYLTVLQAKLWLSQLNGHTNRLKNAIDQIIAFSQGVGGSALKGSGIAQGSAVPSLTKSDSHAIEDMSGCGVPGVQKAVPNS